MALHEAGCDSSHADWDSSHGALLLDDLEGSPLVRNGGAKPLPEMILKCDLKERALVLGGGEGNELPSAEVHEVGFVAFEKDTSLIVVRVRLFASLGTPSHHIVVGRRL